jgi:hypothetical protein
LNTETAGFRTALLRWAKHWQTSALSTEQCERARRLELQFEDALEQGRFADAADRFQDLHPLSQNHFRFHVRGHWMNAVLHRKERRLKASAVQLYLAVMAPYGTARRRMAGRAPSDTVGGLGSP